MHNFAAVFGAVFAWTIDTPAVPLAWVSPDMDMNCTADVYAWAMHDGPAGGGLADRFVV
jgi:hypothetical protein